METPEVDAGLHLPIRQHGSAREMNRLPLTTGELGAAGNLDKIRDLLFGDQVRESERRLNRLEERLAKGYAELKEDTRRRFESLELFVKKEIESLTERLKAEQIARDEALSELSQTLRDTVKSFEKKTGQLDEQTNKAQRELRQQIMEQSKTLRDEFLEKSRELSESFGRAVQELRREKADRHALVALLTEVAVRLNNDLTLPTVE
jgi:DNA anti-recombination protein RmuC